MQPFIHVTLHIAVPGALAWGFFPALWVRAWTIMLLTMVIDLDHLLADPIFDSERCSIGFHPLHSYWIMPAYVALAIYRQSRLVGLGLVVHMMLDGLDCLLMDLPK